MTPIRLRSSRAFTAIEVCVIIVILAALTAILYPVYYRSQCFRSNPTGCYVLNLFYCKSL